MRPPRQRYSSVSTGLRRSTAGCLPRAFSALIFLDLRMRRFHRRSPVSSKALSGFRRGIGRSRDAYLISSTPKPAYFAGPRRSQTSEPTMSLSARRGSTARSRFYTPRVPGGPVCDHHTTDRRMTMAIMMVGQVNTRKARTDGAHLYGPAARCKPKVMIWKVGLAHLQTASGSELALFMCGRDREACCQGAHDRTIPLGDVGPGSRAFMTSSGPRRAGSWRSRGT